MIYILLCLFGMTWVPGFKYHRAFLMLALKNLLLPIRRRTLIILSMPLNLRAIVANDITVIWWIYLLFRKLLRKFLNLYEFFAFEGLIARLDIMDVEWGLLRAWFWNFFIHLLLQIGWTWVMFAWISIIFIVLLSAA